MPHDIGCGSIILDKKDLEIGHLYHKFGYRANSGELDRLRLLREVRNALAHHEPLRPERLQALVCLG